VRPRQGASGGTESGGLCRPRLADVNEADEQELRELRFKVGDALPADDPLARFILVVSMGLNDNSLSNTRFVNTKEPYELLYFFRLASGHLHELANRLRRAHEEWPEVQQFVAGLQEDYRDDFESIVRLADPNDDVGQKLERLRNEFFRYPDLRRKTAERGKLPLMEALTDAADTEGTISLGEYLHSLGEHVVTERGRTFRQSCAPRKRQRMLRTSRPFSRWLCSRPSL
jgi:hypothetical protein